MPDEYSGNEKPGKRISRPTETPEPVEIYTGRITEQYMLQQHEYNTELETFRIRRARLEDNDFIYQGNLSEIFPDETALEDKLYIENKFKNALHDHQRLSAEGRGMPKFIPLGDRLADKIGARVRESVVDTYWVVGGGKLVQRQLYMDLAGTGVMAVAAYYNDESIYPQYTRLDPRYCYPDYRNGKLYSLVYIETMRTRVAALQHPGLGLNEDPDSPDEIDFIAYYDKNEVCEAFVQRSHKAGHSNVYVVQRWIHNLGTVPVAYSQLATYDGAMRGLFDQLAGPMMVRNKAVRFVIDYMEQTAYSPLFAQNIENATETPGPTTVYRADPDAEPGTVHLERIGPATSGGTMWNLISYMGDQEQLEATQPASRSGAVPQSQASGSFVNSTQGTLTSVIVEMQEGMSNLREQLGKICMQIDEKWLDITKPLIRPVGKKKTYKPSKDIAKWYYHTIEFGAGAGLGKQETDNRVINHLAARIVDRGTAREQIDYIDDSSSIEERIDRENVSDALLQRFATDPTTPLSSLANLSVLMEDEGMSLTEALKVVAPELFAAQQAAQPAPAAAPGQGPPVPPEPGQPGAPPATGAGGLPAEGTGQTPVPQLPRAPLSQVLVRP